MRQAAIFVLVLGLVAAAPAAAQGASAPELLRDVNPAPPDYPPADLYPGVGLGQFQSLGEAAVFLSNDPPSTGCLLWGTDGTDARTRALADLCPPEAAYPSFWGILSRFGHLAFASDSAQRLWRTDGTPAGTYRLGEVRVGEVGPGLWIEDPEGGKFLFAGCTDAAGCEPWASDGTPAGTGPLADLVPGRESSDPRVFTLDGRRILFVAGSEADTALWSSDGTAAGTRRLAALGQRPGVLQIVPLGPRILLLSSRVTGYRLSHDELRVVEPPVEGYSVPAEFNCYGFYSCTRLYAIGSAVFLSRWDTEDADPFSLWRTDGTEFGTRRIEHPPLTPQAPLALVGAGGRAVFAARTADGEPTLWAVAPGSLRAEPLTGCPDGCPAVPEPVSLAALGSRLFFAGHDPARGIELWSSDGTGAGTRLVADLCPGACDGFPEAFRSIGESLFFTSQGQLWRTAGHRRGTVALARVRPTPEGTTRAYLDLAAVGQRVVFEGLDEEHGIQLWVSDLTPAGTRPAAAIGTLGASSRTSSLTSLGGRAVFAACDGAAAGLWGSDGTPEGTTPLPGPAAIACDALPFGPLPRAGGLAFVHWDGRLWRTDGTAAGTFPVGPPVPYVREAVALGDRLLYFVDPPPTDEPPPWSWELWASDGTAAGTELRFRLPLGGSPFRLSAAGSEALFVAQLAGPPYSYMVWRTDGTEAGTRPILAVDSQTFDLPTARLGGSTYFLVQAEDRPGGPELWVTDGTAEGTVPVLSDPVRSRPREATSLFAWRQGLYFFARVGGGGPLGLWVSDGTAGAATLLRKFIPPPLYGPAPPEFTPVGERLLFVADDGVHGREPWATDGTAAGTRLAADLRPGPSSSGAAGLRAAGGRVYFSADDGVHGQELWASDGTAAGTRLAADLRPGLPSGSPEQLTAVGPALLFVADDGIHGREPWRLALVPGPCETTWQTLCLLDGRVQAEAFWRRNAGPWRPAPQGLAFGAAGAAGVFAFLPGSGGDVAVRLAENPGGIGAYVAGLSTLDWALVLTDTSTGLRRRYFNVAGRLGSLFDPDALAAGAAAADRVLPASEPVAATVLGRRQAPLCEAGPRALCLLERYTVEAAWRRSRGPWRPAPALPLDAVSGALAVNGRGRPGVVVKAVDGRAVNGHLWIFGGFLTGFEVKVTVTDTATGERRTYSQPAGQVRSFADTGTF